MTNHGKIVNRIKKLLNLGHNNPSQEEAERALLLAQEMIMKHRIDESDLIDAGMEAEKVIEVGIHTSRRVPFWVDRIASVIAKNFRCELYINVHGDSETYNTERSSYERTVTFVGLEMDVTVAQQVFNKAIESCNFFCDWFLMEAKFEKEEELTRSERSKYDISFRAGFVRGLKDKFDEQVAQNNWALVLVTPGLVLSHLEKNHPNLRASAASRAQIRDLDAYSTGKERGGEFVDQHGAKKQKERGPKLLGT